MDIKYQAVGNVIYELYMGRNIEKHIAAAVKNKIQDTSLRIEVISYRQLKQESKLNLLNDIEPLLNMRGREMELSCLYLLLYSKDDPDQGRIRLLDCAPFSEQGLTYIFHNPGMSFHNEEDLFSTALNCMEAAARISAHFFTGDLALSKIQANVYRSFYAEESNSVTAILLTGEDTAADTKLIKQIAKIYQLQVVTGTQKDLNGKKCAVLRFTKKLA